MNSPIRIRLSAAASEVLTASGEGCFTIVHRVMRGGEELDSIGRWEITLAPIEWQAAKDASRVLLGQARAAAIRPPKAAPPAPPAIVPDRRPDAPQAIVSATTAPATPPHHPVMTASASTTTTAPTQIQ